MDLEGAPLVPGGYAGPGQHKLINLDVVNRENATKFWGWVFDVTAPPSLFLGLMINVSRMYGTYATEIDVLVAVLMLGFLGSAWWMRRNRQLYGALACFLLFCAVLPGFLYGKIVFTYDFNVSSTFRSLVTYVNIDPTAERGSAFMDAGEVYFKEGTRVDTTRGMAIMSKDMYCLAPIVREEAKANAANAAQLPPPQSGSMDWFAVGVNCCDESGEGFTCGTGASNARSGLRLLRDDQRHFFKFAADEWNAKFGIPVDHPLFFEWVVDPLADVAAHELEGVAKITRATEGYAVANFVVATLAYTLMQQVFMKHAA